MKVCQTWSIPYLSLDGVDPKDIGQLVKDMEPKPRVILCTISTIADEAVQRQIGRLPIKTVCLDEVQVCTSSSIRVNSGLHSKVINSDDRIGWGGFLPFW